MLFIVVYMYRFKKINKTHTNKDIYDSKMVTVGKFSFMCTCVQNVKVQREILSYKQRWQVSVTAMRIRVRVIRNLLVSRVAALAYSWKHAKAVMYTLNIIM